MEKELQRFVTRIDGTCNLQTVLKQYKFVHQFRVTDCNLFTESFIRYIYREIRKTTGETDSFI